MKILIVRRMLAIAAKVLKRTGTHGYLLKGSVVAMHPNPLARTKASGDVDILVPGDSLAAVHRGLLEEGFSLQEGPTRISRDQHHLDRIYFQGVPLELHRTIAMPHFGISDDLLLENAVSVDGPLHILSPEAMFFHVAAHSMWHQCLAGMKSAWLGDWILRWHPGFNWERLGEIVDRTPTSRAFWAPLALWKEALGMEIPDAFYERRPRDGIQKRLNRIADRHGLVSFGFAEELEPFLIPASILLSCSDPKWLGPVAARTGKRVLGEVRRRALWTLGEIRSDPSAAGWARCARKRIREFRQSYHSFVKP